MRLMCATLLLNENCNTIILYCKNLPEAKI